MADGNWYGVGATRAMGCTQCTCEARDYVYCVDLCPGKYTNGTKESFKKSCNYHFFYCDMFVIKYRLILYQINNSNILQFSEVNVHAHVNSLCLTPLFAQLNFIVFIPRKRQMIYSECTGS